MQQKKILEELIETYPKINIYAFTILSWNCTKEISDDCIVFNLGLDSKTISQILLLNKSELEYRDKCFLSTKFQEFIVFINLSSSNLGKKTIFIYLTGRETRSTYSEIYLHAQVFCEQFLNRNIERILPHLFSSITTPRLKDLKGILMVHHSGEVLYKKLDKDLITQNSNVLTIGNYQFSYRSVVHSLYRNPEYSILKRIKIGGFEICVKLKEEFGFIFIVENNNPLLKQYLAYIIEKFYLDFYGELFLNPRNDLVLNNFHTLVSKIFNIS